MSVAERIEALKARHETLEAMIQQELSRPHPDDVELAALKKEKLKIKDQMASATRH